MFKRTARALSEADLPTVSYLFQLRSENLSPYLDNRTALNCIKEAEQMGPPSDDEDCKTYENYRWHKPACSRESVLDGLQGLKDSKGRCLDCISVGSRH